MAQVITLAGEKLFATKAQANQQLDIDTFIFANVTGQDPAAAIDRNEGIPTNAVVHQQNVQQTGRINDNVVVYSTVLDSVTGPFEFNWVGLYSSVNQTLVAISHVPTVAKTITAPGSAGNTLNRNFGIEYSGIADLADISVSPETWQLDFSTRLSGMDELTRQLASDMNGKDSFIDDGFKVVPRSTANTFSVTPGVGYVSGLRVELKQEHILTLQTYPQFVYLDAYFAGNASSEWKPNHNLKTTSEELFDYVDDAGKQHYIVKLAEVTAADEIEDLRESFTEDKDTTTKNFENIEEFKKYKKTLPLGKVISIKDSKNGNGSTWEIVLTSSVMPDDKGVVQSTANPTLSIKRIDSSAKVTLLPIAGELDAMPRITAALATTSHVQLVGDFAIASNAGSNIVNKLITGIRGKTKLVISSAIDGITGVTFPLQSSELRDMSVVGTLPQSSLDAGYPNPLSDDYFTDADGALAYADALTYSFCKLYTNQSKVENVEISFVKGYAVDTNKNNVGVNGHALDTGVRNCRIYRNLGAINIEEASEYMKFTNNSLCWNIIGVNKRGGNNAFIGNNIDHNRVNFITREGHNNSHGSITGGSINHGKLAAFIAHEIISGESVVGVNIFDSGALGLYIRNSAGVNVSANFSKTNVYCIGQGVEENAPGVNKIHNSLFKLHGVNYKVHRNWNEATQQEDPNTPDNFVLSDNLLMEGQASRDGSSWDEVIVNDSIGPDSQGFVNQLTVLGDTNSKVVVGRPLDGTKYMGSGAQVGAVKITLPMPYMANTLITATVDISTTDGKGCLFTFDCYALTSGDWALLNMKGYEGDTYKVRFGEESGKAVIYIGELNTQFNSAMVSVENIKIHKGVWAASKYWKRGWLIELEDVAFSNVTEETPDIPTGSDRKSFSGDLNTIDNDNIVYAVSASNTPDGNNGFCTTTTTLSGSAVRFQSFYDMITGATKTRSTTTGDTGYGSWA
ncbi:phage tail protein [Pseudoalteromonas sp. D48-MNA-CIBAN-0056]|uniref:phage tail-collar fiber domain-containing protein n=1 Tax=Pseudoalteromonas sp. D48-MNA-CIBAN-0056 TaxID=3140417 RepID=UPI00332A78AF